MEAGAFGAKLLDAQTRGIVEAEAMRAEALDLDFDVDHMLETVGKVATSEVEITVTGDFAGYTHPEFLCENREGVG